MSENDKIDNTKDTTDTIPMELSLEDGSAEKRLTDILNAKAKEKLKIQSMNNMHLLKKSKFYYNSNGDLREHIATYNGYAILIKQEKIKEDENDKEVMMFPSLIKISELKNLKRVNGNIIRKLQPDSIHEYEKLALIVKTTEEIDKIRKEQ
jgi:hypothetical protein